MSGSTKEDAEDLAYEEELQRQYVMLKVELAQVQSDTERHRLMSTQLSSETDQLRSAIGQSQNAEREMRDLAKQLADEVGKLQREVKAKEEERDQVKAEAERTQEQRAQLEKTLEVLGGRKVTELLNARRSSSRRFESARNLDGRGVGGAGGEFQEGDGAADGGLDDSSVAGSIISAMTFRSRGMSVHGKGGDRGNDSDHPSLSGPDAFLFDQGENEVENEDQDSPEDNRDGDLGPHQTPAAGSVSGRTLASVDRSPSVTSTSADSLRMSVKDFMRGLDKEC